MSGNTASSYDSDSPLPFLLSLCKRQIPPAIREPSRTSQQSIFGHGTCFYNVKPNLPTLAARDSSHGLQLPQTILLDTPCVGVRPSRPANPEPLILGCSGSASTAYMPNAAGPVRNRILRQRPPMYRNHREPVHNFPQVLICHEDSIYKALRRCVVVCDLNWFGSCKGRQGNAEKHARPVCRHAILAHSNCGSPTAAGCASFKI